MVKTKLVLVSWFIFGAVSIVGFVANIALIPLTSFITTPLVYFGLIALGINDELAKLVFYLADVMVTLTLFIQDYLASKNQQFELPLLSQLQFYMLAVAVFLVLIPAKIPGRSLGIVIILIVSLQWLNPKKPKEFKMVVFDIGQGLAVYIRVNDKHIIYDTGYGNRDFSMASTSMVPYLKQQGVKAFDKVIISHSDSDHSGGLVEILKKFEVKSILAGENDLSEVIKAQSKSLSVPAEIIGSCHTERAWSWSKVNFEFIQHLPNDKRAGNNASCVLMITTENHSILLPGDIEKKAELALIKNIQKHIDIVVAPHHGSETSSTRQFVEQLQPKSVIFSAGFSNQWSFPREKVIERYSELGADIYTTYKTGAITLELEKDAEVMVIKTQRNQSQHFYEFSNN